MEADVVFDEMWADGTSIRRPYKNIKTWLDTEERNSLKAKRQDANDLFRLTGITFNVYGSEEGEERLIPFDIVPRVITANEWNKICKGLEQRVRAINAFLYDIYHDQEIVKAGVLPLEMLRNNPAFLLQMIGVNPPGQIYTHISGVDLIRTEENEFYVLEDNVRTPSGVSYMLENRETMLQMFPELFTKNRVQPIQNYSQELLYSLKQTLPDTAKNKPNVCLLTPGPYNSAYFEHAFLADQMGIELVQGNDLKVVDGFLAMRTTQGHQKVDVVYKRLDDEFLDPLNFNEKSSLGVPGLFDVYRKGRVTIANAPGTGIADDKAMYSFMPEIVEFYSGEFPLLQNVPTWRCAIKDQLNYVLDNIHELVIKQVHGSGGYGMMIGPTATKKDIANFRRKLIATPQDYIAQPTLSLSTVPIFTNKGFAPRHVDLRPFVQMSPEKINIVPGGLTRVAMSKGSLVVNSSQGGGTKDTWVLEN